MAINQEFLEKFSRPEYRKTMLRENVVEWLRSQIIALREQRSLTQDAMAHVMGTSQSTIARYEKQDYGKWNISTLLEYADAYDVALDARFVTWGTFLKRLETQGENEEVNGFDIAAVEQELTSSENTWVSFYGGASLPLTEFDLANSPYLLNCGLLSPYWLPSNWAVPPSPLLIGNAVSTPAQSMASVELNASSDALADAFWQGVEYGKKMAAYRPREAHTRMPLALMFPQNVMKTADVLGISQ
jgi:transcriptional regulator with XRE-family HTH domain